MCGDLGMSDIRIPIAALKSLADSLARIVEALESVQLEATTRFDGHRALDARYPDFLRKWDESRGKRADALAKLKHNVTVLADEFETKDIGLAENLYGPEK